MHGVYRWNGSCPLHEYAAEEVNHANLGKTVDTRNILEASFELSPSVGGFLYT